MLRTAVQGSSSLCPGPRTAHLIVLLASRLPAVVIAPLGIAALGDRSEGR